MHQIKCRDLRSGDVMLKIYDHALLSKAIRKGQQLAGAANPNVVHAGLMFDSYYIIEAQGGGINANDMRVQNVGIGYHVFRCIDGDVSQGAGTCAKMMFDIHKNNRNWKNLWLGPLTYAIDGAVGSLFGSGGGTSKSPDDMEGLLNQILNGRWRSFFCSQFVVYVYQYVARQCGLIPEQAFTGSDAKFHPSILAAKLVENQFFREIGYMIPNER